LTPNVSTQRVLSTYRNVTPLSLAFSNDRDTALAQVEERLKEMGAVKAGDTIVLTVGAPMGSPGGTNTLKIINVK
jgi:pyruvate kinase